MKLVMMKEKKEREERIYRYDDEQTTLTISQCLSYKVEMTSLLVDEVSKWSPYQRKGLDRFRYQRP